MQKVMTCTTEGFSMRAKIIGWTIEDGDEVLLAYEVHNYNSSNHLNYYDSLYEVPIMHIKSGTTKFATPPTILHALGDGWKLLAPPVMYMETLYKTNSDEKYEAEMYEWWLVQN